MSKTPDITTLKNDILAEIHADAPIIAKKLFGDGQAHADATNVRRADYLKYLRTMWDNPEDPEFRARLRTQLGDKRFIEVAAEVHGQPKPSIRTDKEGRVQVTWNDPLAGLPPVDAEDMLNASEGVDASTG